MYFIYQIPRHLAVVAGLFFASNVLSQTHHYWFNEPTDSTYNCYLVVLPETPVKGLVVRDYSKLPNSNQQSPYRWQSLLLEKGIAVLFTSTTSDFPELYLDDKGPSMLDDLIHQAALEFSIPLNNIFIGGMSSSGTRALRFTQYCLDGKSKHNTKIKGVFAVDSPLDMERFYLSASRHKHNFKGGMLWEANHMLPYFMRHFGASAQDDPAVYRNASIFSYVDVTNAQLNSFTSTPVLIYHEPDIDWWIQERGAGYFDINSFDLVAFTNTLRYLGNKEVKLVTTTGKGFDRQGNRKCHSWTIVDETELVDWIESYME